MSSVGLKPYPCLQKLRVYQWLGEDTRALGPQAEPRVFLRKPTNVPEKQDSRMSHYWRLTRNQRLVRHASEKYENRTVLSNERTYLELLKIVREKVTLVISLSMHFKVGIEFARIGLQW